MVIVLAMSAWPALASDHQADEQQTEDVWLFETGVRAQVTHSLIAAIGCGIGLDRGPETPIGSVTAGAQFSL